MSHETSNEYDDGYMSDPSEDTVPESDPEEPGSDSSGGRNSPAESEEDICEEVDSTDIGRNQTAESEEEILEDIEANVGRWSEVDSDPSDDEGTYERLRDLYPALRTLQIMEERAKERAVRKIVLTLTLMGNSATVAEILDQDIGFRYDYTTMLYLLSTYEHRRPITNPMLPLPLLIQDHIQYAMNPEGRTRHYRDHEDQSMRSLPVPCLIEGFPFPDSELRIGSISNFMSWAAYQEIRWTKQMVTQDRQGALRGLSGRRTLGTVVGAQITFQGHQFLADFQILANRPNQVKEVIIGNG